MSDLTKITDKFTPQWKKDNRKVIIGIALVGLALLLFGLYRIFYGKPAKDMFKDDSILKTDLRNMKAQNDSILKQSAILLGRVDRDSVRLVSLEGQLNNLPNILNQLQAQYNAKLTAYTALPLDKRFLLFAGYVSQIDTTTK